MINKGPPTVAQVGYPGADEIVWDDLRFPFSARGLYTPAGNLDFNEAELGVDYDTGADTTDGDAVGIIVQLPHKIKLGSNIRPHLHWMQNQNAEPNWLMKYRIYDNGETPSSWTSLAAASVEYTYASGTILQVSNFPEIDLSSLTGLSALVDVKIFRDNANDSTLFSGADPYSGDALSKEFDVHYQSDMLGSRQEEVK